jgi:TetR/AcrR family transcriptional regulator, transcriptional repressor for nem operon
MSASSTTKPDTAQRILDAAEGLVQVRGFNGFSYADVADELQITKASLHYHFRGKAELGHALITRYASRFTDALLEIDREVPAPPQMLNAYVRLYRIVLERNRMCLCGILAAEYQTLPEAMREAITSFFADNELWLTDVLARGQADGSLSIDGPPRDTAQMIVSGLEGAMLVARTHGGLTQFRACTERLLAPLIA